MLQPGQGRPGEATSSLKAVFRSSQLVDQSMGEQSGDYWSFLPSFNLLYSQRLLFLPHINIHKPSNSGWMRLQVTWSHFFVWTARSKAGVKVMSERRCFFSWLSRVCVDMSWAFFVAKLSCILKDFHTRFFDEIDNFPRHRSDRFWWEISTYDSREKS